jgi:hypothetical protein
VLCTQARVSRAGLADNPRLSRAVRPQTPLWARAQGSPAQASSRTDAAALRWLAGTGNRGRGGQFLQRAAE